MRTLVAIAACLLLAVPAAAHTTVPAADGKLCITVGSLNEPVTTYTPTGLDMIVRVNNNPGGTCASADRGDVVEGFQNHVESAVAVAPSGAERDVGPLRPQRNEPGSYTSAGPYVWTEPGQYVLRLTGEYDGASFTGDYKIAGEVPSLATALHPPLEDATLGELHAAVASLQGEVAGLEAQMAAMQGRLEAVEAHADEPASRGSPASPLVWASVGLVGLAWAARRREG